MKYYFLVVLAMLISACTSTSIKINRNVASEPVLVLTPTNCEPYEYEGNWLASFGFVCTAKDPNLVNALNASLNVIDNPKLVSANPASYSISLSGMGVGNSMLRIVSYSIQSLEGYNEALKNGSFSAYLNGAPAQQISDSSSGYQNLNLNFQTCEPETFINSGWEPTHGVICYILDPNLLAAAEGGTVDSTSSDYVVTTGIFSNRVGLRIVTTTPTTFGGPSGYLVSLRYGRFSVRYSIPTPGDPGPNNNE